MVGHRLIIAAANSVISPKQKMDRAWSVFIVVDEGNKITKVKSSDRQDPHFAASETSHNRHGGVLKVCYKNSHLFPCRPRSTRPGFDQISRDPVCALAVQHCIQHMVALVSSTFQKT